MKLGVTLDILNQKDTPAFNADTLANRPAAGFTGRVFIDTNNPSTGLYRDTGTTWVPIADSGAGTTGTLQQVTTNGNTTNQGISITSGALTLGTSLGDNQTLLNLPANVSLLYRENAGSLYGFNIGGSDNSLFLNSTEGSYYQTLYFGDGQTTNIFGISASDDSGVTYNSVFVVNQNKLVGINTNSPTATLDVHGDVSVIQQLNQTTATNNTLLAFQNSNAGLWRIGNFYNAGANDFGVFDVIGAIQPITIKKTTGQILIGTSNVGSGKLVVSSTTSDNGIQIVGANAPSLRIDNAESGATKRIGLGISTATNNFIQGSADRDMCIFNGSTTASPILFGIYGTTNVQEAARISASRNFLIGKVTDSGEKLQISGTSLISGTSGAFIGLTIDNSDATGSSRLRVSSSGGNVTDIISYAASHPSRANQSWIGGDGSSLTTILQAGGVNFITGLSSGNVGMGTNAPYNKLTIEGITARLDLNDGGGANRKALIIEPLGYGSNNYARIESYNYGTSTGGALVINSLAGNVLIGTTTDNGNKLKVNGNTSLTGQLIVSQSISTDYIASFQNTNANSYGVIIKGAPSPNNAYPVLAVTDSTGTAIYLRVDSGTGNVSIGTNPGANSSLRIAGLPTSSVGLSSGEVWNDSGTLKIA